jgi:sugar lactone lactonase YvrE
MFDEVPDVMASRDHGLDGRPLRRRELARVHQPATIHPPLQEAGIPDVFVMDRGGTTDGAEDAAVEMVDVAGRITERGRVPDDHDPGILFVSFMRRLIVMRAAAAREKMRCHQDRVSTMTAAMPPMSPAETAP